MTVRLTVRHYETDALGHLNGTVYIQYAEHARAQGMRPAFHELIAAGLAPVNLETTVRYLSELRVGDEVEVSCEVIWGPGKTSRIVQEFRRQDGVLAAEVTSVCGLLDLKRRQLVDSPRERMAALIQPRHPRNVAVVDTNPEASSSHGK